MNDNRKECPKCANAARWYGESAMCYDHLMSENAKLQGQIDRVGWAVSEMVDDHEKGDFELSTLAQSDLAAISSAFIKGGE